MTKQATSLRKTVTGAKRVVIKIGTNVLLREDGSVAEATLSGLAASIGALWRSGREVAVVSSGAIGIGRRKLGLQAGESATVCAAAGQSALTSLYENAFGGMNIAVAQILVTGDDFADRNRRRNLVDTLRKLLELRAIPILNENDVISQRFSHDCEDAIGPSPFRDNDMLAALIAKSLEAELLIVLTDVDGLYTAHPDHEGAELVRELAGIPDAILECAGNGNSRGRGGMRAKLQALGTALEAESLMAVIANGRTPSALERIVDGQEVGTLIVSRRLYDSRCEG